MNVSCHFKGGFRDAGSITYVSSATAGQVKYNSGDEGTVLVIRRSVSR